MFGFIAGIVFTLMIQGPLFFFVIRRLIQGESNDDYRAGHDISRGIVAYGGSDEAILSGVEGCASGTHDG